MDEDMTTDLPPSLAVTPNTPYEEMSVEHLEAEREFWRVRALADSHWVVLTVALECRDTCDRWLEIRRRERAQ